MTDDPAYPGQTHDGRPAQRNLRSPEPANPPVVGGTQLTGPTDARLEPVDPRTGR